MRGHPPERQRRRKGRHGAHLWPCIGVPRQEDHWGVSGGLPGRPAVWLSVHAPRHSQAAQARQAVQHIPIGGSGLLSRQALLASGAAQVPLASACVNMASDNAPCASTYMPDQKGTLFCLRAHAASHSGAEQILRASVWILGHLQRLTCLDLWASTGDPEG